MSNNIEEDIKIVEEKIEEWKKDPRIMIQPEKFKLILGIENLLNAYKKNQNIVDEIREKINERQFELQQEYKDFKDDIRLKTLQEIYYMFKEE